MWGILSSLKNNENPTFLARSATMAVKYKRVFALIGVIAIMALICFQQTRQNPSVSRRFETNNYALTSNGYVSKMKIKRNNSVHAERWIVVTTIAEPTPDVMFLAEIPGWKVVVVGDTKTPVDWSYPNCEYLSVEDQRDLGFETVPYLPVKSYARKSVGYLYAIANGAKVIYETDDDNRPLDLLHNFVLEPTMWGLVYGGKKFFNPYRHFGQPTLWPRGYPLSAVGENITTNYLQNHWKTPSIQQGVVNGDPDMDAIFRLTRKKTLSVLNVTFDGSAPPAIVPAGVFSPFNSQNTLFLYDALWALLIPTTTSFRVCDIWRGYWAQRLLWEMGGNLGFFPPNAFQKRNSHSYLLDAVDEKDLYFETERLLEFLGQWRCDSSRSFFECVVQLSTDMAVSGFWKEQDARLTAAWVKDLIALGYKEPARKNFGSQSAGAETYDDTTSAVQTKSSPKTARLTFWAAEQSPPHIYHRELPNRALVSHVNKIEYYCRSVGIKVRPVSITDRVTTFPNILLIIELKSTLISKDNINFYETMYGLHFPHIVYCGTKTDNFNRSRKTKPITFLDREADGGDVKSNSCLTQAMRMHYNVDGYLYVSADTLLNVWNIGKFPLDKVWLNKGRNFHQDTEQNSYCAAHNKDGLKGFHEAIAKSKSLGSMKFDKFFKTIKENTGFSDSFYEAVPDIFYVPKRLKDDVIYFVEYFSRYTMCEALKIPTVLAGIERLNAVVSVSGEWRSTEMKNYGQLFSEAAVFLHPVKISRELQTSTGRQFFCERYLPYTMRDI